VQEGLPYCNYNNEGTHHQNRNPSVLISSHTCHLGGIVHSHRNTPRCNRLGLEPIRIIHRHLHNLL